MTIPTLSKPLVYYEIRYVHHLCAILEKKSYDDWLACFNQRPCKPDSTIHWDRMLWGREIQVEIEFVEVSDESIWLVVAVDVMPDLNADILPDLNADILPDLNADILPDSEERAKLFSHLLAQSFPPKQSTSSSIVIYKNPESHCP